MTNPMQFPDGFVFGGATAAYQVEGETRTHGKGKVPWDDFLAAQGRFSPDPASDFYNKYPVDIDLCQRFGINGIRVSIAWSRIFPNGTGEINPEGVAFYHELFATCNKAGVIPYVTLDHFDTPEAFYQDGGEGFLTRTTIDAFVEYAKFCFAEFTEVKHWFTFNEIPATAEGSFIVGNWPHGEKYRLDKAFQLMHNMMVAHAKAVVAFHEGGFEGRDRHCPEPGAQVSPRPQQRRRLRGSSHGRCHQQPLGARRHLPRPLCSRHHGGCDQAGPYRRRRARRS